MKNLYLIRHAKSEHTAGQNDIDRALNERGQKDAPMMAKRLKDRAVNLDAIISSPANRALSTAKFFANTFLIPEEDIIIKSELYLPEPVHFFKVIQDINDKYDSIAIFSHNNGITEFASLLGVAGIDHMPTCSIFAVSAFIDSWKDFRLSEKEFKFFDSPKY